MDIALVFLCGAAAYLFVVWFVLRLVIPHLGFRETAVSRSIPPEWREVIGRISLPPTTNEDFLHRAYGYIVTRYTGSRVRTVTNFWKAFQDPFSIPPGYMPCTLQNFLLRVMLVASGRFANADIEVRVVPLNLFIHQYLRVRIRGGWIDVDPWSAHLGRPLGEKSFIIG